AYRQRGYNAGASADVKNAYTTAQAYCADYPDGTVAAGSLTAYGFTQTPNVTVTVAAGTLSTLVITAKHNQSNTTYSVDSTGLITKG
ncbi:MAG: pilus assembly protein, partial [Pseudomonadota bacterium]